MASGTRNEPGEPAAGQQVVVCTAPVAEGHLASARALSEEIARTSPSARVTVVDALAALPRPARWLLGDAYRWQLGAAPWLFGLLFAGLRRSRILRRAARGGLSLLGSRAVLRAVHGHRADVIVSTWPPATLILGSLRLRGKLRVPVCAVITDFAGVELWANDGVDLHLVMHESLVPVVERVAGAGSVQVTKPLVSAQFRMPRDGAAARRALGLPLAARLIVVSGGGWAVGDLRGAIETSLELDDALVVCLAGRDAAAKARLEAAFAGNAQVTVLEFTDRMNDLLAAADVLVHSTGGVTCLEALARGCPIVAYGAPPGHAPLLAKTMSNLGLLVYASSAAELGAALRAARRQSAPLPRGRDAATLVLGVVPRVVVRFRARLARTAAAACTLVVALFVFLASDATYPLVAEALGLPDTTSVVSHRRAVALVVQGRRTDVLALAAIRSRRFSASVAVPERLSRADVLTLRAAGLDPIPALRTGGISSWPDASGQLLQQARRYGTARSFYYLAPREGFTFANYLLGWNINGRPIQAGLVLASGDHHLPRTVHRGEVVVADLGAGAADRERLLAAVGLLEQRGFAVSSVQGLTSGGHGT